MNKNLSKGSAGQGGQGRTYNVPSHLGGPITGGKSGSKKGQAILSKQYQNPNINNSNPNWQQTQYWQQPESQSVGGPLSQYNVLPLDHSNLDPSYYATVPGLADYYVNNEQTLTNWGQQTQSQIPQNFDPLTNYGTGPGQEQQLYLPIDSLNNQDLQQGPGLGAGAATDVINLNLNDQIYNTNAMQQYLADPNLNDNQIPSLNHPIGLGLQQTQYDYSLSPLPNHLMAAMPSTTDINSMNQMNQYSQQYAAAAANAQIKAQAAAAAAAAAAQVQMKAQQNRIGKNRSPNLSIASSSDQYHQNLNEIQQQYGRKSPKNINNNMPSQSSQMSSTLSSSMTNNSQYNAFNNSHSKSIVGKSLSQSLQDYYKSGSPTAMQGLGGGPGLKQLQNLITTITLPDPRAICVCRTSHLGVPSSTYAQALGSEKNNIEGAGSVASLDGYLWFDRFDNNDQIENSKVDVVLLKREIAIRLSIMNQMESDMQKQWDNIQTRYQQGTGAQGISGAMGQSQQTNVSSVDTRDTFTEKLISDHNPLELGYGLGGTKQQLIQGTALSPFAPNSSDIHAPLLEQNIPFDQPKLGAVTNYSDLPFCPTPILPGYHPSRRGNSEGFNVSDIAMENLVPWWRVEIGKVEEEEESNIPNSMTIADSEQDNSNNNQPSKDLTNKLNAHANQHSFEKCVENLLDRPGRKEKQKLKAQAQSQTTTNSESNQNVTVTLSAPTNIRESDRMIKLEEEKSEKGLDFIERNVPTIRELREGKWVVRLKESQTAQKNQKDSATTSDSSELIIKDLDSLEWIIALAGCEKGKGMKVITDKVQEGADAANIPDLSYLTNDKYYNYQISEVKYYNEKSIEGHNASAVVKETSPLFTRLCPAVLLEETQNKILRDKLLIDSESDSKNTSDKVNNNNHNVVFLSDFELNVRLELAHSVEAPSRVRTLLESPEMLLEEYERASNPLSVATQKSDREKLARRKADKRVAKAAAVSTVGGSDNNDNNNLNVNYYQNSESQTQSQSLSTTTVQQLAVPDNDWSYRAPTFLTRPIVTKLNWEFYGQTKQLMHAVDSFKYPDNCVREINFGYSNLGWNGLADGLCCNSTIEVLIVQNGIQLGKRGAKQLARGLRENHSLRELTLYNSGVETEAMTHLASCLRINTSLKILNISNNPIGGRGLAKLSETLRSSSHNSISKLSQNYQYYIQQQQQQQGMNMNMNQQQNQYNDHISTTYGMGKDFLQSPTSYAGHGHRGGTQGCGLRHLIMDNCGPPGTSSYVQVKSLSAAVTNQESEALSGNINSDQGNTNQQQQTQQTTPQPVQQGTNLTDDSGIYYLTEALKHNTVLEILSLSNCDLSPQAGQLFAKCLPFNKRLAVLNLSGNKFGDHEAFAFARVLGVSTNNLVESAIRSNSKDRRGSTPIVLTSQQQAEALNNQMQQQQQLVLAQQAMIRRGSMPVGGGGNPAEVLANLKSLQQQGKLSLNLKSLGIVTSGPGTGSALSKENLDERVATNTLTNPELYVNNNLSFIKFNTTLRELDLRRNYKITEKGRLALEQYMVEIDINVRKKRRYNKLNARNSSTSSTQSPENSLTASQVTTSSMQLTSNCLHYGRVVKDNNTITIWSDINDHWHNKFKTYRYAGNTMSTLTSGTGGLRTTLNSSLTSALGGPLVLDPIAAAAAPGLNLQIPNPIPVSHSVGGLTGQVTVPGHGVSSSSTQSAQPLLPMRPGAKGFNRSPGETQQQYSSALQVSDKKDAESDTESQSGAPGLMSSENNLKFEANLSESQEVTVTVDSSLNKDANNNLNFKDSIISDFSPKPRNLMHNLSEISEKSESKERGASQQTVPRGSKDTTGTNVSTSDMNSQSLIPKISVGQPKAKVQQKISVKTSQNSVGPGPSSTPTSSKAEPSSKKTSNLLSTDKDSIDSKRITHDPNTIIDIDSKRLTHEIDSIASFGSTVNRETNLPLDPKRITHQPKANALKAIQQQKFSNVSGQQQQNLNKRVTNDSSIQSQVSSSNSKSQLRVTNASSQSSGSKRITDTNASQISEYPASTNMAHRQRLNSMKPQTSQISANRSNNSSNVTVGSAMSNVKFSSNNYISDNQNKRSLVSSEFHRKTYGDNHINLQQFNQNLANQGQNMNMNQIQNQNQYRSTTNYYNQKSNFNNDNNINSLNDSINESVYSQQSNHTIHDSGYQGSVTSEASRINSYNNSINKIQYYDQNGQQQLYSPGGSIRGGLGVSTGPIIPYRNRTVTSQPSAISALLVNSMPDSNHSMVSGVSQQYNDTLEYTNLNQQSNLQEQLNMQQQFLQQAYQAQAQQGTVSLTGSPGSGPMQLSINSSNLGLVSAQAYNSQQYDQYNLDDNYQNQNLNYNYGSQQQIQYPAQGLVPRPSADIRMDPTLYSNQYMMNQISNQNQNYQMQSNFDNQNNQAQNQNYNQNQSQFKGKNRGSKG